VRRRSVVMRLVDFGLFPLTWLWKRVKMSVCVERERERERDRILFGVGVGDECVDHEIAVGIQVSPGSIVSDLRRGGARTHARKLARRTLDGGRRGQALLGGFGGEGEQ